LEEAESFHRFKHERLPEERRPPLDKSTEEMLVPIQLDMEMFTETGSAAGDDQMLTDRSKASDKAKVLVERS